MGELFSFLQEQNKDDHKSPNDDHYWIKIKRDVSILISIDEISYSLVAELIIDDPNKSLCDQGKTEEAYDESQSHLMDPSATTGLEIVLQIPCTIN